MGLIMAVLGAAVGLIPSQASQSLPAGMAMQITPTQTIAPEQGGSQIGSTDGIVLMGIIIVMIVVLPVLLQRRTWER